MPSILKCSGTWLILSITVVLSSAGCRSGMPGMRMFGMNRGEPSPEALAASGPSTSYPPPPSASATPEAIASVAGGTAVPVTPGVPETAQVAGIGRGPGYAQQASTNLSAAQANGFGVTQPAGFSGSRAYTAPSTKPSGYSFGAKSFTPKPTERTPASGSGTKMPPALAGGSSYNKQLNPTAGSSYAISNPAAMPKPSAPKSPAGFELPTNLSPALAEAASMPPTTTAPEIELPDLPKLEGFAPPAAVSPEFSTASRSEDLTAPGSTFLPPQPSQSPAGYSPGSTGGAIGYPTGDATPNTSGSIFR